MSPEAWTFLGVATVASSLAGWTVAIALDASSAARRAAWSAAVVTGLVGALSARGAPTGDPRIDAGYRLAIMAAVIGLAPRSPARVRGCVSAGALATAALMVDGPTLRDLLWISVAAGATVVLVRRRRSPASSGAMGALHAAVVMTVLLSLPTSMPARAPSALAGVVVACVLVGGVWSVVQRRRWLIPLASGALAIVAAVCAVAARDALAARRSAEQGLAHARSAVVALSSGDVEGARLRFSDSAADLSSARARLERPAPRVMHFVPLASPNVAIVRSLVAAGEELAGLASDASTAIDLGRLRRDNGTLDRAAIADLQRRVRTLEGALARAVLATGDARGPWITPTVLNQARRLDVELDAATRWVSDAGLALEALPGLLGGSGPRRYLLVVPTPSEARGAGGLIGSFGEITADDGRLSLVRFGRTAELNAGGDPPRRVISGPADYLVRYQQFRPAQLWQNVTLTPDFPTAATVMAELFPQSGGSPVDGVISADPVALAGVLRLTGPVTVEGWPEPIMAETAASTLMFDTYAQLAEDQNQDRIDLQARVAQEAWRRLLSSPALSSPAALVAALGPAARARHLQIWSRIPTERAFLEMLGVDGRFVRHDADALGVISNNAGGNKIDWFLRRSVRYDISVDRRNGLVTTLGRVRLSNEAPSSGLPAYIIGNQAAPPAAIGTNVQYLSIYSRHPITSVHVSDHQASPERGRELGLHVASVWVRVPPGESIDVSFTAEGRTRDPRRYELELLCQALPTPDVLEIDVTVHSAAPTGTPRPDGDKRPVNVTATGAQPCGTLVRADGS